MRASDGELAQAAEPLPDEVDRDDDDDVDRGDDEEPGPEGRRPPLALVDLDAVDGRQPADQAEDQEEVVRPEDVAGHQAVEDGVDEGQVVEVRKAKRSVPNWKGKANW